MNEIQRRWPRRMLQKQVGAATELLHQEVMIDHDGRRRVGAEDDAIRHFQNVGVEIYTIPRSGCRCEPREFKTARRNEIGRARASLGFLGVNFIFFVREFEKLVVHAH